MKFLSLYADRRALCSVLAGIAALMVLLVSIPAPADESKPADAYESVWSSLSELLRRREYGNASSLLESLSDEPDLQYDNRQIQADQTVVAGLLQLEKVVIEQLVAMPEGSPIEISGSEFVFVRYEKSRKGDSVVLRLNSGGERTKRIVDLPSSTWIQLAEPHLKSFDQPDLILGVFSGFDRSADIESARRFLNSAAGKGAEVTAWLKRLDQAELQRKQDAEVRKTGNADPLIGSWRVIVGRGDGQLVYNAEYRRSGSVVRNQARRPGTRSRLLQNTSALRGRWELLSEGKYRITYETGATGEIVLAGDRYWGRTADGTRIMGIRQVTGRK